MEWNRLRHEHTSNSNNLWTLTLLILFKLNTQTMLCYSLSYRDLLLIIILLFCCANNVRTKNIYAKWKKIYKIDISQNKLFTRQTLKHYCWRLLKKLERESILNKFSKLKRWGLRVWFSKGEIIYRVIHMHTSHIKSSCKVLKNY